MKTIKLLTIGLFTLCTISLQAQDSETERVFNKEISVDLKSLIPGISSPSYIRYRITGKKKKKKVKGATRISLNFNSNFRRSNVRTSSGTGTIRYSFSSFNLKVGRDWGIRLAKFQPFFGVDVKYGATFRYRNQPSVNYDDTDFNMTMHTGTEFFLGLRYFVHPRISITAETSYAAMFDIGGNSVFEFITAAVPISAIAVGYSF